MRYNTLILVRVQSIAMRECVCLSVCLRVCPLAYLKKDTSTNITNSQYFCQAVAKLDNM